MKREVLSIPIDVGLLLTKMIEAGLLYVVGLIIYVAGGLTIIVAGACVLFGLTTGDGVLHLLSGSTKLLLLLAGASVIAFVLRWILIKVKMKVEKK